MKLRIACLLLVVLGLPHASAVEEADAPDIDPVIAAVGHHPEVPEPGTQWEGFIRFQPGHNVTAVSYQICKVGIACFAPPTPARQADADTWRFNTTDYTINGQPVDWGIIAPNEPDESTWRVGVQYLVFRDGEETIFANAELMPEGIEEGSAACEEAGPLSCAESHYFAFDMPAKRPGDDGAQVPAPAAWLALLVVAALLARRR